MTLRAIVLMDEQYHVLEGWYPFYRLCEAGFEVKTAGREAGAVVLSKDGYPATIDCSACDLSVNDFDCLVIPGGYAADFLRRETGIVEFVAEANEAGKIISAICHGGWLLASAGIVKGKKLTSFFSIRDDLVNAGAFWEDAPVVRDGNLITSRGPDDLPNFMQETIGAFGFETVAAQ